VVIHSEEFRRLAIKIVLVEGRKLLREGLSLLLEKHADLKVVGEADDTVAAVKVVRALAPDVVVLTVASPAHTGRPMGELIHELVAARPATRLIIHAMFPTPAFVREVLRAGAAGCLSKECASDELVSAIRTVAGGGVFFSRRIADAVVQGYVAVPDRAASLPELSAREREILRKIADGRTTKQIAASLKVSTKTIETHRRRMMQKLRVKSVAELTKYAVRAGLTSLELPV